MKNNKKLKISTLKIDSFVTTPSKAALNDIKGGVPTQGLLTPISTGIKICP